MSAVIKTTTPFVIESILIAALEVVEADPIIVTEQVMKSHHHRGDIKLGDILTNRSDYNGSQHFRFSEGRWVLRHDSTELSGRVTVVSAASKRYKPVGEFLQLVGVAYEVAYQQHLELLAEQERTRLEHERKERVEVIRQQATAKAKAQGYSVKESIKGGQIQLVLTRTV